MHIFQFIDYKSHNDKVSYSSSESKSNTVANQYSHQVGGHSTILSIDNRIFKPLIHREYQFYQYLSNHNKFHNFLLSPYIPKFYGSVEVLKTKDSSVDKENRNANIAKKDKTEKKKGKGLSSKHPIGTTKNYIILEDITVNYKRPCIVDIKIGTRQRGIVCSSTTSTSLGVRICGMKLYRESTDSYQIFDRYVGRSLNPDSLEDLLYTFFTVNSSNPSHLQIQLLNSIIDKLIGLHNILSNDKDPFPHKIYSSSLLIVYEGSTEETHLLGNDENLLNSIKSSSTSIFSTSTESFSSVDENSSNMKRKSITNSDEEIHKASSPININSFLNGADRYSSSNSTRSSIGNVSSISSSSSNIDKLSDMLSSISSSSSSCTESYLDGLVESNYQSSGSVGEDITGGHSHIASVHSNSSLSSGADGDSNTTDSSRCSTPDEFINCISIKNDVKMIDFAHAIPCSETLESADDDGYLFGINNLKNILSNIKFKLQRNNISK